MGYDVLRTECRRRDTPGILSRSSWILLTAVLGCLLPGRVAALSWNRVPQNQMVSPGGTATFQCQVQDRGTNDVIWNRGMEILFRNAERNLNTPLRYAIEGEFNLVLRNVSLEDNQEFTCNVWNLGAKSARLILLLPPEPPTITRNVTSPLQEGTSLGLTCSTRGGNPAPTLRWLRNGQERIGGASSTEGNVTRSELPVLLTRTDNQANFSCVVGNEALGNSTLVTSTVLSVQYRPYVSFKPYTPLVLALGASATLSCDVDANPSVSAVAWQLNANGLPERTPTLQFGAARRDQAGNYTCTASNSVGTGSSSVSVSVFYAPILTVDQTIEGEEMTSLTLTCDVDAQPPVDQVTWRSVDTGLVVSASRQLSFPSLQRSQAGNYSCSAANAFALSGQAQQTYERVVFSQVFVLYKPGVASIRPVADVSVGERVDIKCSVTPEGYPRPTYEWRKGDVVLSQQSSTMTILSATLGDNALYTCTPSNSLGAGTPNQISLTVNELPSLQSPLLPASLTVGIGESAPQSLSCLARGRPTPTLTWHKDGDPQPLEVKFPDLYRVTSRNSTVDTYATLVTSTLDLAGAGRQGTTSLRVEDMGNYTCRVTSQSFSDVIVQTTEFYVQFQPQPQTQAVRVAVNLSQNAELPCRVRSFPAPSFRWQWRGEELPGAGPASSRYSVTSGPLPGSALYQGTLLVTNVQPSDLGVYTCTASNTLGQSDLAITLSLTSVPEMPTSLQAGQVTWESVELRWEGGFDGGLPQSFKVRELGGLLPSPLDVNPPSASSFNVTRLHPKTAYTFAVYGVNGLGQGKQSSELVVLTQAATVPPTNAHGEERHDVECTERSMKISIPSYLLPQGNVTLLDPSCPLTLNGTDYVIDVGLSQCGTTIHFTDDHVVFVNTILTKTDTGAVDLTVPVGCQYPRLSNVSIAYMPLTHQARFFETNWGKLDVSMEQYKDDQFSTSLGVAGSVARMSAGQTVYLQIHIHDVSQADLGVMPRICVVSPSPSPLESNVDLIIRNGCPVHEHVRLLPSPGPAYFRFAFTADTFRFDSGLVYVHCETSLCELGPSCPAFCGSQGNVNATSLPSGATAKPTGNTTLSVPFGRRRRSAEIPKESGTLLSAGPLLLVDEADAHAVPAGLVATIASIAAAAMVVVVALAVALHRARARNASVEKRLTAISVK